MAPPDEELLARLRDDDPPPGTMIGEFRVDGKLGEGGMATVYAAVHELIGKRAAVKVISRRLCADLHAVGRFFEEARTVHRIGHPNIVDTFAFGTLPDGRAYFMMEWLQGESLASRLKREPLPLAAALDLLLQICDALEAAHEKGVIHRDLKPDNVFLVETRDRPFVKVLDFGLAKLADHDVTAPRSRSRSGVAIGTAGYMSPEQARGKPVAPSTDVYALGAMAFEMITGRMPFEGESAIDILAKHLAEPPPSPRAIRSGVPHALDRLIVQMLDKDASARPPLTHVRQVLADVRARPEPERRRVAIWWWALPAALAAAGAVAWMLLAPRPAEPTISPAPPTVVATQPAAVKRTAVAAKPATVVAKPVMVRAKTTAKRASAASTPARPAAKKHGSQKDPTRPAPQGDYTLDPFE